MRLADYKGHTYEVKFLGNTKFGKRAHLQFLNGDKSFWVAADLVSNIRNGSPPSNKAKNNRCKECGGPIKDAPHHRAMGGLCGNCAFDEYDM